MTSGENEREDAAPPEGADDVMNLLIGWRADREEPTEKVTARTGDILYASPKLRLEVVEAAGPGAPAPGSSIERTAAAVAARGCFRAAWSDEARRERILDPPEPVQAPQQVQEANREQRVDRSEGRSMSM